MPIFGNFKTAPKYPSGDSVWCGGRICEERDASGANVTKRFYAQGVKLETGPTAGAYYYTRDHLGSIRELTDGSGNVRARYSYDPFGRRTKVKR